MRICIFGAGAVGSFLAARLAHAGFDVAAVARGAQLDALRTRGVRLEAGGAVVEAPVRASADPAELGPQDAVIFTTKAHGLGQAAQMAAPLIRAETALVFAQNGIPWWYAYGFTAPGLAEGPLDLIDPDHAIWNGFGPERAVGAVVRAPNALVRPGVVRHASVMPATFYLGEPKGGARPSTERVAAALTAAGVNAPILPDIRRTVWAKLLLNASGAPCGVLTGVTERGALEDADLRNVSAAMVDEVAAVAAAHGFWFDAEIAAAKDRANRPNHKSSMLQDLEAGRRMEIEPIVGSVVAFAKAAGVPTPTFDVMLPLLRMRARTAETYEERAA